MTREEYNAKRAYERRERDIASICPRMRRVNWNDIVYSNGCLTSMRSVRMQRKQDAHSVFTGGKRYPLMRNVP